MSIDIRDAFAQDVSVEFIFLEKNISHFPNNKVRQQCDLFRAALRIQLNVLHSSRLARSEIILDFNASIFG